MHEKQFKLKILPSGNEVMINDITDLREALLDEGLKIKGICGGYAQCGMCKIKIIEGKENISDIKFLEKGLLGNVFHITKERLSCQVYISGDVTIDVSEHLS